MTSLAYAEANLTRFIQKTTWEDLPPEVQERARVCMMDNLGSALAGIQARASRIAAETAQALFLGDQSTLIYSGRKVSALGAAFANGVAANAVDIDDSGMYTWGHPGAQALAAALALCEARNASGAEMLAASVVGYEVMFRAARCWYDSNSFMRCCGSWGSTGCAALAAHIMKLPPEQILNALGIAEFDSPYLPLMKSVDEPTMVKHGIGLGALTGLMSADLASRDFTGTSSLFSEERYSSWVGDIGENFILPRGITWKDFACCAWSHPAVLAIQRLLAEGKFVEQEISKIIVEVYEAALHLGTRLPETTEQAQFNLAWPIAALIVDGEVGPKQVLEPRLSDERIRAIAAKVELTVSDELTRLYQLCEVGDPEGRDAARVTIELKNGQKVESDLSYIQTYAEQNWNRDRMEKKFRWLLEEILPKPAISQLVEMIWNLDKLKDISELTNLISTHLSPVSPALSERV